jgi:tetratricopeptide (TPR) repeat protein
MQRSPIDDMLVLISTRMERPPSTQVVGWGLVLLVGAAFATGLGYPLVFGDYAMLTSAKLAAYGRSLPTPTTPWLAEASFGWTSLLVGADWFWHRAFNLMLHGLSVAVAFLVARRMLSDTYRGDVHPDWVALLAAGLFALHPVSVYATAYLSARSSLLAGFWCLVALWSLLRSTESTSSKAGWLVPLACLGAVASAPLAVVVPLVLLIAARCAHPALPIGSVRTVLVAATAIVFGWMLWALISGGGVALSDYLQHAGENAVRWLRGVGYVFVPATPWMAIDMPEPVPPVPGWAGMIAVVAMVGLVAIGFAAAGRSRGRVPAVLVGCIGAFGMAAMLYPRAWTEFVIWHAYPAVFFVCALAAWALAQFGPRALVASGTAAFAIVAVLGIGTLQTFSSHMAVWDDAVRVAERGEPRTENARIYVNRATLHRASGHPIAAIQDYTKALTLAPDLPRALRGRAQAHVDDKRFGEALQDLQRLLEVDPKQPITHADIGLVQMQAGKFADAWKSFNTAVQLGVREPRLFLNRGLALYQMGGLGAAPRALDEIERALALDPGYALAHFNRALIFEQAARAGVRLRDAPSPEIMRLVAAQNIARACKLGHRPACDVERARAEEKSRLQTAPGGPSVLSPETLRDQGLPAAGR